MSAPTQAPIFVVVLTDEQTMATPRAVGPFHDFDVAQAFSLTLLERYQAENANAPAATVVRVESDYPGVVIGEL